MRPPSNNVVTQTEHGTYRGVDYSPYPDPYIYAPENGTVTFYADAGTCGNNLQIKGVSGYTHGFCHLEFSDVKVGQSVAKGQRVGKMGYTGYTIPDNVPAGTHLHAVIRNSAGVYFYPPSVYNEPFGGGQTMSTTDLGLARVLAHGVLGRNGYNGKPNALDGSQDADLLKNHVGKETNAKIWEFYNSAEGKDWRDSLQPKAYAERDALKRQVAEVTADRDGLIVKLDAETAKNAQLTEENAQLQITVNEQKQKIAELEAQQPTEPNPDEVTVTKDGLWEWFKNLINVFKKG